jgi:hypothetical protein
MLDLVEARNFHPSEEQMTNRCGSGSDPCRETPVV